MPRICADIHIEEASRSTRWSVVLPHAHGLSTVSRPARWSRTVLYGPAMGLKSLWATLEASCGRLPVRSQCNVSGRGASMIISSTACSGEFRGGGEARVKGAPPPADTPGAVRPRTNAWRAHRKVEPARRLAVDARNLVAELDLARQLDRPRPALELGECRDLNAVAVGRVLAGGR